MREFVTHMFNSFDFGGFISSAFVMFEQIYEHAGTRDQIFGDLGEHREESGISGNEANHLRK